MPTIRIDDEVYATLQAEAEPFVDTPNSVLRRRLSLDGPRSEPRADVPASPSAQAAKISGLVQAGLLHAGEQLEWRRKRVGDCLRACVLEDGRLRLEDGSIHDTPSGAARSAAGYEANGWTAWRRPGDGRTLGFLMGEYERIDRRGAASS